MEKKLKWIDRKFLRKEYPGESLCERCQEGNNLFCKFKKLNTNRAMVVQSCPKYRKVK